MESSYHIPVMLDETLDFLITDREGLYIDGTFGGGGHAAGILERLGEEGRVIGCDADRLAIENGAARFADSRLELRRGFYGDLCKTMGEAGLKPVGLLLDLGVSSRQLDTDQIGLSYRTSMPLDMRFDPEKISDSAADLVNRLEAGDLATLLRRFGEEPAAWKIAQAIATERKRSPISTTADLRQVIEDVIPERYQTKTLSRVFQALRIAVNDELGDLERGLKCFTEILRPGGRIVVLTYHSLEDRIVKHFFRDAAKECRCPPGLCSCDRQQRLKVITRRPVMPGVEEIESNRRARSAKLRVAERI